MSKQILAFSIISILTISILSQDASASILSASTKNPPQATADLLTLNNTSGTHLWWVDSTGKMFVASNADFHSSSTIFDSSSIKIRNPASTFAYTLTGGAIVANRTLNIPITTGTDTLATLGLAQTFTGAITSSGGITMSGSNIALVGNQLTDSNDKIYAGTGAGQAGTIIQRNAAGGQMLNLASGTATNAGLQIFKTTDLTTNYSGLRIDTDYSNSGTWTIQPFNGGSGSLQTLILGMNGTSTFVINTSSPYVQFKEGTTGGVTATLGTNAPNGITTTPYTWIKVRSSDGSTVYIPAWK